MKKLRVFIASPSDVSSEREIFSSVLSELQRTIGELQNIFLEIIKWETHAWPDVADDAQAVINQQIGQFDILVGVMWKRFGTPTKRASSGTEEEFERAYQLFKAFRRPKIMFYFRTTPFYPREQAELKQFARVLNFRQRLQELGALVWEYDDTAQFERLLREHLTKQLIEVNKKPSEQIKLYDKDALAQLTIMLVTPYEKRTPYIPRLQKYLESKGIRVWYDMENILPGQDPMHEQYRAIEQADLLLLCLTKSSLGAGGTMPREILNTLDIREQVKRNGGHSIPILVVLLDHVQLPPSLMRNKSVSMFKENDMDKVMISIQEVLGTN